MSLLDGYLRDHADDLVGFTGWVGDDFWAYDMILDPVPGYSAEASIDQIRGCC